MTLVRPFTALRPVPSYAARFSAPPYDVVNGAEVRREIEENELSFFRVTRSEGILPPETDAYSEEVYQTAKAELKRFVECGILVSDESPSFYVYQLQMGSHAQTGIVGCASVAEYQQGLIRIHEKTRVEKELDRTRHMLTAKAHSEPVFLAYREQRELSELMLIEQEREPLYDFAAGGVRHILWKARRNAEIAEAFRAVPVTYIADGHHRAASSRQVREELKRTNPRHSGEEEYNFFPAVFFPHTQLQILPYNRVIRRSGKSPSQILSELQQGFEFTSSQTAAPAQRGEFGMYLDRQWNRLRPRVEKEKELDVDVLYELALAPVFNIGDPRTDKNIDFVGGIRGTQELERLVNAGEAVCAFSLYPVSMEDIFAVADRGGLMPPKSTWFEPKLRSGLFIHLF